MRNLDYKVSRDTIFLAGTNQLGGWLSDINKKRKKVFKKIGVDKVINVAFPYLGKKVMNEMSRFESKNREGMKKWGAVAAAGVAVYFAGPAVLAYLKTIGGTAVAQAAGKKTMQILVANAIKKKLTPKQQAKMTLAGATMTPEQFMSDPELAQLAQEVAAEVARQQGLGNNADPAAIQAEILLAREGAYELEHQTAKNAPPKMTSFILPAVAILAFLI